MATDKKEREPGVCPDCGDVWLYCKCPMENPICPKCLNVKTECYCPGNERKRLDFWED